jgi:hypothetical protein
MWPDGAGGVLMLRRLLRLLLFAITLLVTVEIWRHLARTPVPTVERCPAACVQMRVDRPGVHVVCLDWEDERGLRRCPEASAPQQLVGVHHD